MVVRGVPHRLAKDGWWLEDVPERPGWVPGVLLGVCVVLADQMLWAVGPGAGFVVWIIAIGIAVHVTLRADVDMTRGLRAWALLLLGLVPALEVVQFTSVMLAFAGLSGFAVFMVLGRREAGLIVRAMMRLPFAGLARVFLDGLALRFSFPSKSVLHGVFLDWGLPLGVGAVFLGLVVHANPLVSQWITELTLFQGGVAFNPVRMIFWLLVAGAVWPLLRLADMVQPLGRAAVVRKNWLRTGLMNARSVIRALLVFNLIFAAQSLLDIGYLWGGIALPEGMTYAEYAHRGAYPLLLTALMAGLFALMAQPFLEDRWPVRGLLYLWVAQTVFLVLSSILRLDLYVDAYGLTRLRFAALVWMVVVALGLVLIIMQIAGRHSAKWFVLRAAGLGVLALYAVSLVNVDGFVARSQLSREDPDRPYICGLGEGAAVALHGVCSWRGAYLHAPDDWREWGYRNARLRRSLAQMEVVR